MAGRIRSIKPELLDDEKACSLSDAAWRVWVSTWVLADDFGNARAGGKYIAAHVWQDTARAADAASALSELCHRGLITQYVVDGQSYLHIRNWEKHQRIDNAGKRRVPPPNTSNQVVTTNLAEFRVDSRRNSETLGGFPLDHDLDLEISLARDPTEHVPVPRTTEPALTLLTARDFASAWETQVGVTATGNPIARQDAIAYCIAFAAKNGRDPLDSCQTLLAAFQALRAHWEGNGRPAPPPSVEAFLKHFPRVEEWVAGKKPAIAVERNAPRATEPSRPVPPHVDKRAELAAVDAVPPPAGLFARIRSGGK